MDEGDEGDDPGGGLQPQNPEALNIFKDNSYMVIMKGTNDELKNSRPKVIYDLIHNKKVIPTKSVKQIRNGNYLIKIDINNKDEIFKTKVLGTIPVTFEEAWDLNQTKVTIRYEDLQNYDTTNGDHELTNELKLQNPEVLSATIQSRWQNNIKLHTQFAVVTLLGKFTEIDLESKKLALHFQKLPLKLFVPSPKQCKVCWAFGHISTRKYPCRENKICGNCSSDFHLEPLEKCTRDRNCPNCGEFHSAWYKGCIKYKKEKAIWELATKERISYKAAKYQKETTKNNPKSYVNAAANPTQPNKSNDNTTYMTDDSMTRQNEMLMQQIKSLQTTLQSITKQLYDQTKTIRYLCSINKIHHYVSDTSQVETDEDDMIISKSDDEMILPTPQNQVKASILPFTDAELTKLPFGKPRGNNNGSASFKRAKERRENKKEKSEQPPPSKHPKLNKNNKL